MKINLRLFKTIENNLKNKLKPDIKKISEWTKKAARESLNQADSFSRKVTEKPGWGSLALAGTFIGFYDNGQRLIPDCGT